MSPLECFVQFNLEKFSNLTFVCLSVRESHDLTRVSRWTLESRLTSKFPTRRKMTNTNIGKYCAAGNKTSSQPPQLFIHIYRCTSQSTINCACIRLCTTQCVYVSTYFTSTYVALMYLKFDLIACLMYRQLFSVRKEQDRIKNLKPEYNFFRIFEFK